MTQIKKSNHLFASFFVFLILGFVFVAPVFADEKSGLIPCTNNCGFDDLLTLVNTLIEKSIEYLVLPIFVFILMYSGFLYITAWGDSGVHAKVRRLLKAAILGLLLVLCSWLIVKVIISGLGYDEGLKFLE